MGEFLEQNIKQHCILDAFIIEELEKIRRERENRRIQPTVELPAQPPAYDPNPAKEDEDPGVVIIDMRYDSYR